MKAGIFQIGERSAKFTPATDYLIMCVGCGHHTWCNHTKCVVCLSNVCPCLLGVAPLTVRRCTLPPSSHPFCLEICNRCRSRQICLIQYACHVDTPHWSWSGGGAQSPMQLQSHDASSPPSHDASSPLSHDTYSSPHTSHYTCLLSHHYITHPLTHPHPPPHLSYTHPLTPSPLTRTHTLYSS